MRENMNNKLWTERLLTGVIAALMNACAVWLALTAMGFYISAPIVYIAGMIGGLSVSITRNTSLGKVVIPFVSIAGFLIPGLIGMSDIRFLIAGLRIAGVSVDSVIANSGSAGVCLALMLVLPMAAIGVLLTDKPAGRPFAMIIPIASIIISMAVRPDISLWLCVPGLVGCVAVFATSGFGAKSGIRPAIAITALCVAMIAVLLTPPEGTTWEPLKNLANRIRSITDEYSRFSEERVAFSINAKGYDHGGMISDTIVTMLGGPADPSEAEIMRVTTDEDILLRGTIKQNYTGYSWVDERVKARYLYYDFTHSNVRNKVFGTDETNKNSAFHDVSTRVEILAEDTSTLFVPAHMESFEMDLSEAVYYNSTGEIFLTRSVQPGDTYAVKASVPQSDDALIRTAEEARNKKDARFEEARADYCGLPGGIDDRVYQLTMSVIADRTEPAEKAIAIRDYLANNYKYTLEPDYPPADEDFVSRFLLKEKKGYCSYFATAMVVMCRIADIPARYVEGYYVHPENGSAVITGKNAHAWVEVYLNGIGWTELDPTARAYGVQHGWPESDSDNGLSPNSNSGIAGSGEEDTPFENNESSSDMNEQEEQGDVPPPDTSEDGEKTDSGDQPDNGDSGGDDSGGEDDEPEPENEPDEPETPPQTENDPATDDVLKNRNMGWIWIVLIILLCLVIIAGAIYALRRRIVKVDPLNMCRRTKNAGKAGRILYRAMLTQLSFLGYAPAPGEMPEAFAARVDKAIPNEAYVRFTIAVTESIYSDRDLRRSELEAGRDAYLSFLSTMKKWERIRYETYCVLHGIGSIETIP